MGAILLTQTVADTIQPGDHASTFGAGPLVSAVAEAVFRQISQAAFLANVRANGEYLAQKLQTIATQSPLIEGVRGKGLMWGLLSTIPAGEIVVEARNHGLIILVAGEKIVRLLPPLVINRSEIDILAEKLTETLQAFEVK